MASELVDTDSNVATLAISESTTEWHKQRLVTRNLPLRDTFDPQFTGANVTVYVLDSGIDILHPEMANADILPVHNPSDGNYLTYIGNGNAGSSYVIEDNHGHGTAVSSLVVGETVGVSKDASLGVVKISGDDGNADISDVVEGVNSMFNHRTHYSMLDSGGRHRTAVPCPGAQWPCPARRRTGPAPGRPRPALRQGFCRAAATTSGRSTGPGRTF